MSHSEKYGWYKKCGSDKNAAWLRMACCEWCRSSKDVARLNCCDENYVVRIKMWLDYKYSLGKNVVRLEIPCR